MGKLKGAADKRGRARFAKERKRMKKGFGAAETPEHRALIKANIDPVAAFIKAALDFGRPTRKKKFMKSLDKEVYDLVHEVRPAKLALAALNGVCNATARPIEKNDAGFLKDKGRARAAKEVIGAEIQRAVREHVLSDYLPDISRSIRHASNLKKRQRIERWKVENTWLVTGTGKIPLLDLVGGRIAWDKKQLVWVGNWGLDCCHQAPPDVFPLAKDGKDTVPTIAAGAWDLASAVAYQQMLDRRPAVSSLEPLEPWTWYRNEDGLPFLRGCRDEAAAKKAFEGNRMRRHIGAINYLRATEWRLNDYMLDVYQSWIVEPLLEISQHRRDKGRRDLLQWDRIQASLLRGKTFWTDMHCEWRGRALPIPYFNYGRDDAMRSLFRFAKGAPIGERGIYWLKVSLANCYGGDIARKTFDQRAAWVDANMDRLRELVSNPAQTLKYTKDTKVVEVMLGGKLVPAFKTPLLKEASDPFQLLAHAHELVACNNNPKFETTLPLPFDASNSGAQYYSVLKRDRKGARLTNLIDAKRPNDLYFNICARAEGRVTSLIKDADAKMSERLRAVWAKSKGLITRKVIKGIVVAYLYGQQTGGATKKLTLTLRQAKTELVVEDIHTVDPSEDFDGKMGTEVTWRWPTKEEFPKGYLGWFTKIVHEEIAAAIPGAAEVRGYIRSLADVLGSHGKVLEWESPTGVPISNRYHGSDMSTIKMWLGALPTRIEHDVPVGYEPELDGDRCSQGAAANLIHSIEASHMALVALACERAGIPLVTVHDCFGTLGCYVEDLRRIWLEELRNLFKDENILQDLHNYAREVLGPDVELPPVPTRGVLRIEEINGRYALS